MNAVVTSLYGDIQVYHLSMAWDQPRWKTRFSSGLVYFNYGQTPQTDAAGNEWGSFRPRDWCWQLSAARSYLRKWDYGGTVKLIRSHYGPYRSTGLALDAGIHYHDSARQFNAGAVLRNVGWQQTAYPGSERDQLPFELMAGVSQRLPGAPLRFSLTGQRLQRFDLQYNDTAFNNANGFPNAQEGKFTLGKLLDHLVLGATVYLGDRVELYTGYNFLRRRELNTGTGSNGLNGFSAGAGLVMGKWQLRYAQAWYQSNRGLHQLGITMQLNQYFGLGEWGRRVGW